MDKDEDDRERARSVERLIIETYERRKDTDNDIDKIRRGRTETMRRYYT